jgi:prophage regulatory protein
MPPVAGILQQQRIGVIDMLLRIHQVQKELGYKSHATIYSQINDGTLTKPISLGARCVGLPDYEVNAIIQARIAGRSESELRQLVQHLHEERKQLGLSTPQEAAKAAVPHLQLVKG